MNEPASNLPWLAEHWAFFVQRLQQGRLPHALMIEGPGGVGKQHLSQAMVARLLCNDHQLQACGVCRSCKLFAGGAHPDCFDLSPEEDTSVVKVDQVRDLLASLNLTTSVSERKVVRINPADGMNAAAANALLKSLEEPNGNAVLILISSDPARLPVTIRSRCQSIALALPDRAISAAWLATVSDRSAEDISLALAAAGGSPLRAQRYLESPALSGYAEVCDSLAKLLEGPAAVSLISSLLQEHDADDLWRWLSICCSEAVKSVLAGFVVEWLPDNVPLQASKLLGLQKQADINRKLAATPLRGDLLVQDWLIEWAMQGL